MSEARNPNEPSTTVNHKAEGDAVMEAFLKTNAQSEEIKWPFAVEEAQKIDKYPKEYKEFLTAMLRIQLELSRVLDPLEKRSVEWYKQDPPVDLLEVTNPKDVPPEVLLGHCGVFVFMTQLGQLIERWRPNKFEEKLQKRNKTFKLDDNEEFVKFWWQNIASELNERTFATLFATEQTVPFYVEPLYPGNQDIQNTIKAVKNGVKIARGFFEKRGVRFDEQVPIGTKIDLDNVQHGEFGSIIISDTQLPVKVEKERFNLNLLRIRLFGERIREIAEGLDPEISETFVWNTEIGMVGPDGRISLTTVSLYEPKRTGAIAGYKI